jgi:Cu/Zn superoxide dismutase
LRRITKAALGGLAGCALVLGGTQLASGETLLQEVFPGWLTDLDTDDTNTTATTGAFDSAKAKLKVIESTDGSTTFSLEVRDIDPSFAYRTFGSHLHTASCEPGNPTAAGGHYTNKDLDPLLPLEEREVWFTVVPDEYGVAADQTVVTYVPKDLDGDGGIMSIVIHRDPTNTDPLLGVVGAAGPREVCLPLETTWG